MTSREATLEVVTKNMVEILEIDPKIVDPARSMVDLGANSLDIVEVVSCSMRELRVKLPRSVLAKLTNIDGLVDLLWQVQQGETVTPS